MGITGSPDVQLLIKGGFCKDWLTFEINNYHNDIVYRLINILIEKLNYIEVNLSHFSHRTLFSFIRAETSFLSKKK